MAPPASTMSFSLKRNVDRAALQLVLLKPLLQLDPLQARPCHLPSHPTPRRPLHPFPRFIAHRGRPTARPRRPFPPHPPRGPRPCLSGQAARHANPRLRRASGARRKQRRLLHRGCGRADDAAQVRRALLRAAGTRWGARGGSGGADVRAAERVTGGRCCRGRGAGGRGAGRGEAGGRCCGACWDACRVCRSSVAAWCSGKAS